MNKVVPLNKVPRIHISTCESRFDKNLQSRVAGWDSFAARLKKPTVHAEYRSDVAKMSDPDVSNLKDVGGYLLGPSTDGRRGGNSIKTFTGLALDVDYASDSTPFDVDLALGGTAYVLHSTFKHSESTPRYRLILPLGRAVSVNEYLPLCRQVATMFGIDTVDAVSFQSNRLMYWPSIPNDGEFEFYEGEGPALDVDGTLAQMENWQDVSTWPITKHEKKEHLRLVSDAARQAQNPHAKRGFIGAFCRSFTIEEAMETFIPDVYIDEGNGRCTFTGGSGNTHGVRKYCEGGPCQFDAWWIYSEHNTDPCSKQLVNAFDMVRLHLFGEFDKNVDGMQVTNTPSYQMMLSLVKSRPEVQERLQAETESEMDELNALAEEVDPVSEPVTPEPQEFQDIQSETRGVADPVETFLGRYVFVEQGNLVCDVRRPGQHCLIALDSFKHATANVRTEVAAPTKANPESTKVVPVHSLWLAHEKRKTVMGETFLPGAGRLIKQEGMGFVNTYQGVAWPKTDSTSKLSVFLDHIDYLFPVETERDDFLNWLALNIQDPARRCKWTPCSVAVHFGTGRGWLIKLLERLLGAWNIKRPTMDDLFARDFNEYMYQSLICVVEELDGGSGNRYKAGARIRDTLDSDRLRVNRKNKEAMMQDVYCNFFLMTNHANSLVLPEDDRRVYVMSGPDTVKPDSYYSKLYKTVESDDFIREVFTYLTDRDISDANFQRAPMTDAKRKMVEFGRSDSEHALRELMKDIEFPAASTDQIAMMLLDYDTSLDTSPKGTGHISHLMRELGYEQSTPLRLSNSSKRPRVWWLAKGKSYDRDAAKASYESIAEKLSEF